MILDNTFFYLIANSCVFQVILESVSPDLGAYFKSVGCPACQEASEEKQAVVLPDVSTFALEKLLEYVYSGRQEKSFHPAGELDIPFFIFIFFS